MGLEILVADDEALIRMGLRAMLEQMGHRVTLAPDGREALRLARQRSFDLAILDIKMPLTNGLEAAQALSRHTPLAVIFLTAYSEKDLVEQATDLPVHGYLVKPVQPEQLAAAIAVARKRFAEAQAAERKGAERRLVERAKGRLMAGGMSEPEAHRLLQQRARESRRSVSAIAQEILDGL
jgi:two-component system, response regulator PdtaR